MKYIDSSVVIAAYFPEDPHHEIGLEVIEELEKGKEGVISIFGVAEIGGFLSRNSSPEKSVEFVEELSQLSNFHVWYSSNFRSFFNTVTEIAVIKGLSGADAIHAVSALSVSEVDQIVTLDSDFKKVSDMIDVEILS